MKVSILNGIASIGIEIPDATVFEITEGEFQQIKAGTHRLEGQNVVEIPVEPSPLCTIDIPLTTRANADVKEKIRDIKDLFSDVASDVIEYDDIVYQRLSNIYIDRVQDFLTQSEYDSFSAPELGVIFDQKIIDLFSS